MTNDYQQLINKDAYQVFLFGSFCRFPVTFIGTHNWFVINKKGTLGRWEILIEKNCCKAQSWGHLHVNAKGPFESFGFIKTKGPSFWKVRLLGKIEGGEGSLAQKMIEFIEKTPETYPFCYQYFLTGHNSNTYIQWVLNHFPEFPAKLPFNAFGKGYKVKV